MKTLIILLKNMIINIFNLNKLKSLNKGKVFLYSIFIMYILLSLSFTMFIYADYLAAYLKPFNLVLYMIVLYYILAIFITFIFAIYNAKSMMFSANDNDLLLSLPIKPYHILGSRLLIAYLYNLLISLAIMIPVFITYLNYVNVDILYYLYAPIVLILIPIIPTILSSIIGYIIAYLTSKMNYKNLFEIIISFLTIVIFYIFISKIDSILNYLVTHISNLETILKYGFYPIYLIIEIFGDYNLLSFINYIFINIILFILFTYILSLNFKKIISKLGENKTKSNYVLGTLKSTSFFKSLFIKEVKRYFSSPVYVLNTSFGIIALLIMGIATIFYDKDQILKVLELNTTGIDIFPMLIIGIMFIIFMSNTTSASISIEGKNYWILKTLPIDPKMVLKSKILLNILLILPITFIALIILFFTLKLSIIDLLLLFIISIIATLSSSLWGLLINLKFPKMDAIDDVVIVKRSASVMVTIIVPMVIIMLGSILFYNLKLSIDFNYVLAIIIMALSIIVFIEYYLLNNWGIKRYREIN